MVEAQRTKVMVVRYEEGGKKKGKPVRRKEEDGNCREEGRSKAVDVKKEDDRKRIRERRTIQRK
jgi:hypothetical protein